MFLRKTSKPWDSIATLEWLLNKAWESLYSKSTLVVTVPC